MRIGVDLGGTKIEVIALDDAGRELARERVLTPQGNYAATLQAIAALVQKVEAGVNQIGTVGIGTPGALSAISGRLKNSNSVCLNGQAIGADLSELLARPVRMANDANCFALSEAVDGAAAGAKLVFGVIAGTGTGGGIVVNGEIIEGANHITGEWGHNPLPWPTDDERPGPPCYCGKNGCIETFLSGPALSGQYHALTGQNASAIEIVSLAQGAHRGATLVVEQYLDRFARALATVINVLDPDVVVLGGGMSNIAALYTSVPALLLRYVFSDAIRTRVVRALHGDSSGVRGAAWLWGGRPKYSLDHGDLPHKPPMQFTEVDHVKAPVKKN